MTVEAGMAEQTRIDAAFRALHVLPSAPRPLIDAVYDSLLHNSGDRARLRDAYETLVAARQDRLPAASSNGHSDTPTRQVNPWELLHLRPDAPSAVVDAAYRFRRGDTPLVAMDAVAATFRSPPAEETAAERFVHSSEELLEAPEEIEQLDQDVQPMCVEVSPPRVGEGPGEGSELSAYEELLHPSVGPSSPPPAGEGLVDDHDVLSLIEDFAVLSVYEELLGEDSSPLPWGEGSGVRAERPPADEHFVYTYEELLDETPGSPPRVGDGLGEGSAPTLTAADGATLSLSNRPLRIGTHPSCDAVIRAAHRVEARIWRNKGRVLVHALGEPGSVLLNGEPVTWAVLDGGDTLAVGPASFRFRDRSA